MTQRNPTLCLYWDKTIIQKDTRTSIYNSQACKQPKCAATDEWIKMWYISTTEYYSATKENEMMSCAATWMDLEIITLSEVNQKEKHKDRTISLLCGL